MITVFLSGGLGNQMFQIACAYNLAQKNNDTAEFNFNESHTPHQGHHVSKYKTTIYKEFNHQDNLQIENKFHQDHYYYTPIPYKKNLQIIGSFQSEKYFEPYKNDIIKKYKSGLKKDKEKYENVIKFLNNKKNLPLVGVHIRRGDYLKFSNFHPVYGLEYYNKSLSLLKDKIGNFTPIFLSDDKQWCKENFKGIISPFITEIEDMLLLTECDHNIIGNSSFSWWGAYLNSNPNKIVISPSKWTISKDPKDQLDIIPNNWIKI